MQWEDIPEVMDDWTQKTASIGFDIRQAAVDVHSECHVGYYYNPATKQAGVYADNASAPGLALCKAASDRVVGGTLFLSYQDLADPDGTWVKVAHSPLLRRAGELLNFFPGQLPGGLGPNAPSPLAATLTSGVLGAGLGYGGGKLLETLLPERFGKKLGRTGAVLGGLMGAAPGVAWAGVNRLSGHDLNDPSTLGGMPGENVARYPWGADGNNAPPLPDAKSNILDPVKEHMRNTILPKKFAAALDEVELGDWYLAAVEKTANTFGVPDRQDPTPVDVNINALGHTLWESGASPQLAAQTMGAMYAAQQIPDDDGRPGWATGRQLGTLAANAAGDYAHGLMVGAVLNTLVGTPYRASTIGAGNVALGLIGSVIPKLFGR